MEVNEKSPKGWTKTTEKMKNHPEIDNPFALSIWMKKKGYKPHYKESFDSWIESTDHIHKTAKDANLNIDEFSLKELKAGFKEEKKEHAGKLGKDVKVVNSDKDILKIVIAHLREDPKYYSKLRKTNIG